MLRASRSPTWPCLDRRVIRSSRRSWRGTSRRRSGRRSWPSWRGACRARSRVCPTRSSPNRRRSSGRRDGSERRSSLPPPAPSPRRPRRGRTCVASSTKAMKAILIERCRRRRDARVRRCRSGTASFVPTRRGCLTNDPPRHQSRPYARTSRGRRTRSSSRRMVILGVFVDLGVRAGRVPVVHARRPLRRRLADVAGRVGRASRTTAASSAAGGSGGRCSTASSTWSSRRRSCSSHWPRR